MNAAFPMPVSISTISGMTIANPNRSKGYLHGFHGEVHAVVEYPDGVIERVIASAYVFTALPAGPLPPTATALRLQAASPASSRETSTAPAAAPQQPASPTDPQP